MATQVLESTRYDKPVARTLELDGPTVAPWWRRPIWLLFGVLLLATAALFVWHRHETPVRYATVLPARGDVVATVAATGSIEASGQVEVGCEISGTVKEVLIDHSQPVAAGQGLAMLDTAALVAQVRSSKASLQASRAALKEAEVTAEERRADLGRQRDLFERDVVSLQTYSSARYAAVRAGAAVETARARVEVSRATLLAEQDRLGRAEIRSPIDGVVIARRVEPGQTVAANFQTPVLFVLAADLTRMELHLDIDEADVGRVAEQQTAVFTVDAFPDRTFPARIEALRLAPRTIQGVVTYEALLSVDNHDGALRPGMTATATIETARRNGALRVPNSALRFVPVGGSAQPTGEQVWILRGEAPVSVPVEVGLSDERWTEVTRGELDATTRLVIGLEAGQ